MLQELLRDQRVERVYAYNRPAKGADTIQDRQKDVFLDNGFELELLESDKLVYLEGDNTFPQLGLSRDVYEQVRFPLFRHENTGLISTNLARRICHHDPP